MNFIKLFLAITILLFISLLLISCTSHSDKCTEIVCENRLKNGPMIGKSIPGIEMNAFHEEKIKKINLTQYRGRWLILFFYPADFTFVCPTELKELAEYYTEFKNAGAEILGISTDSVYVHKAWHRYNESVNKITYPMLSDRSARLSKALGVYIAERGVSARASFIVNPQGKIAAYEVHHDSIGRSADELLRKLLAAIAVEDGHGGLCPASWKQGDELIHPE